MCFDCRKLQALHKGFRCLASSLQVEGNYATATVAQIFLRKSIIFIGLQSGVIDIFHLRLLLQKFRYSLSIFYMARHTHMQRFQAKIQDERTLRRLHSAEITHQLRRSLGNKSPLLAKLFGVGNSVIGFIRCAQTGELVGMRQPVELAAVDNRTAQASSMTIHILRSRMRYDVCTPFQRTAVNRCREGVIHDQRHTMTMRSVGKFFNIQHRQCGVSNNFAKHSLGIVLKSSIQLLVRSIGRNKGRSYAHLR